MLTKEAFLEIGLHVVELPPEYLDDRLSHKIFLKEIPRLTGEGSTKLAAYQELTEKYNVYRQRLLEDNPELQSEEAETTSLLSTEQLLRYYDGEVFDGFEWKSSK